jgi:16S rRNA (adenine1518-N6/adenine1519-N6)-dimethyltransferase
MAERTLNESNSTGSSSTLLGPAEIRDLAEQLGVSPTKKLGQNFVVDANTVRKIVRLAAVKASDHVLEIGPGLGSLTLGLTETGARVTAVEIDERLAAQLPTTAAQRQPGASLTVIRADGMTVTGLPSDLSVLVANLPYNVSVPILLHLLDTVPSLTSAVVMVQSEVGHRIAAQPGNKVYGVPSVKAAWYGHWRVSGQVSRQVFWPVPNVDSVLVSYTKHEHPMGNQAERDMTFLLADAAFGQRRKMVRQSLQTALGEHVGAVLKSAAIDETARAEQLDVTDYLQLAKVALAMEIAGS